jgi:hypothetical protein
VRAIETDANDFTHVASDYAPTCPPSSTPLLSLTFYAGKSQQINVHDTNRCGLVTNGDVVAQSTAQWRTGVTGLTDDPGGTPHP